MPNRSRPPSRLQWDVRYERRFIALLIVASIVLGMLGYWQLYTSDPRYAAEQWTVIDIVHSALRLFTFDKEPQHGTSGFPIAVQIASVTAALSVGWAGLRAVLTYVKTEATQLYYKQMDNHLVVIGDASPITSLAVARASCDENGGMVLIGDRLSAIDGHDRRVTLEEGDLTDLLSRDAPRVGHAQQVVLALDSQNRTAEVVDFLVKLPEADRPSRCVIQAPRTDGTPAVMTHLANLLAKANISPQLVYADEVAARALVLTHPPHSWRLPMRGDRPLHLLVLGDGSMAWAVVNQLVRVAHYPDCQNLRVTVVGDGAAATGRAFRHAFPGLPQVAELTIVGKDSLQLNGEEWDRLQAEGGFDAAYVVEENPDHAVHEAMHLSRRLGDHTDPFPIYVASQTPAPAVSDALPKRVQVYCYVEDAWADDHIFDEVLDDDAKASHAQYLATRQSKRAEAEAAGRDWVAKPADVPWERLGETDKNKNRDQVDHYEVKLEICRRAGVADGGLSRLRETHPALFEQLSEVEHRRWMASTVMAGYRFGEVRDDSLWLTHPDLLTYDVLTEEVKDYDRAVIAKLGRARQSTS